MTPAQRSSLRLRVRTLYSRLGELLDLTLDSSLPTFAGVVYRLRTRCGKPHCVCLEGKLHIAWCASYEEGGKRRLRTIPSKRLQELQALAVRYRTLRRGRAEINRRFSMMLGALDRLERSLRVKPRRLWGRSPKQGR